MKTAIVAAYHNIGCAGLEALLRAGVQVKAVFTHADNPNEAIWFRSVAKLAAELGISTYAPEDINHPLWVDKILEIQPDYLFSFYYRDIIGEPILAIPSVACFNLHGSLLPKYRGRAPINWAIINGEKETGLTLHHMTPRPDDGDIVCQSSLPIHADDTALILNEKLTALAGQMLDTRLPEILTGKSTRTSQDHSLATYFGGRTPQDGEIDWNQPATGIRNLIRAVSHPYAGAFTYRGNTRMVIWEANVVSAPNIVSTPGTITCTAPLTIMCKDSLLCIQAGQADGGVYSRGEQLAADFNLGVGTRLGVQNDKRHAAARKTRVLILGINGFIGNALSEKLLQDGNYEVHGMDLNSGSIDRFQNHPDFYFLEGDISIQRDWIEYHVKKCDVILPLVAIATPIEYVRNPLRVFELDFEENLRVIRYCVKYNKRVVFPSTSEVYGLCGEELFDEDKSRLVLGPIHMQRWIYSCSKQLLDRVIYAYGQTNGLRFTLFRPFNWMGPRLDSLESARIGSSRAITQLILNLVEGTPLLLIDGGAQKRCFTDIADGVECLFRIIEDKNDTCDRKIINIGNPENEASILELATMLAKEFEHHPLRSAFPPCAGIHAIESKRYYGDGYEDVQHRRPSIKNAKKYCDWEPRTPLLDSVKATLDYFLRDYLGSSETEQTPHHAVTPTLVVAEQR